jgi:hypothetical protein
LIAAHGLQRGVEDPTTGGVLSSATPNTADASHGVRSFAELDAVAYPNRQQAMSEADEPAHPAARNVRFVDAGDGRPRRRPASKSAPTSDADAQPTLY